MAPTRKRKKEEGEKEEGLGYRDRLRIGLHKLNFLCRFKKSRQSCLCSFRRGECAKHRQEWMARRLSKLKARAISWWEECDRHFNTNKSVLAAYQSEADRKVYHLRFGGLQPDELRAWYRQDRSALTLPSDSSRSKWSAELKKLREAGSKAGHSSKTSLPLQPPPPQTKVAATQTSPRCSATAATQTPSATKIAATQTLSASVKSSAVQTTLSASRQLGSSRLGSTSSIASFQLALSPLEPARPQRSPSSAAAGSKSNNSNNTSNNNNKKSRGLGSSMGSSLESKARLTLAYDETALPDIGALSLSAGPRVRFGSTEGSSNAAAAVPKRSKTSSSSSGGNSLSTKAAATFPREQWDDRPPRGYNLPASSAGNKTAGSSASNTAAGHVQAGSVVSSLSGNGESSSRWTEEKALAKAKVMSASHKAKLRAALAVASAPDARYWPSGAHAAWDPAAHPSRKEWTSIAPDAPVQRELSDSVFREEYLAKSGWGVDELAQLEEADRRRLHDVLTSARGREKARTDSSEERREREQARRRKQRVTEPLPTSTHATSRSSLGSSRI